MNSNITYVSSKKLSKTTVDFINNFVDSRADLTDEQKIVRKKELIQEYETKGEDFL